MNEQKKVVRYHLRINPINGCTYLASANPPAHAAEYVSVSDYDQLRQRAIQAEERADRYACDNNELRAKLALAEQDARRWRYVRSENAKGMHGAFAIHEAGDNDWFYTTSQNLDQLIDAAIDASGEGHAE